MSSAPPPILLKPLQVSQSHLVQAVYDASSGFFSQSTGEPAPAQQAKQDLAAMERDEARHILGIFLEDAVVGLLDFRFDDPEPLTTRLGLILLTPERRRQGLGTWALRILEAWLLRDTPTERIMAGIPAQDHAAQSFFAVNGYSFTGQSTRILAGNTRQRLLEMAKDLAQVATPTPTPSAPRG